MMKINNVGGGESPYIFVSYCHKDSDIVLPLLHAMMKEGFRIWYDENITPVSEWDKMIATKIREASYMIAFISKNYLNSGNCKDELKFARDKSGNIDNILLCYLDDSELPDEMELRFGRYQNIRLYKYANMSRLLEKIAQAKGIDQCMDSDVAQNPSSPKPIPLYQNKKRDKIKRVVELLLVALLVAGFMNYREFLINMAKEKGLLPTATEKTAVVQEPTGVSETTAVQESTDTSETAAVQEPNVTSETTTQEPSATSISISVQETRGIPESEEIQEAATLSEPTPTRILLDSDVGNSEKVQKNDNDYEIQVGDVIEFGTYEQDDVDLNGPEPIEWIVLDVQDGKALLLSRYGLDAQPYNATGENVTWEICSLRYWLNNHFYHTAFSPKDIRKIVATELENNDNYNFGTKGGSNTLDLVFLLSIDDVLYTYFDSDESRRCYPTAYAKSHGIYVNPGMATCWWWLRSPAQTSENGADVDSDGTMSDDDGSGTAKDGGVRPAIWISLN